MDLSIVFKLLAHVCSTRYLLKQNKLHELLEEFFWNHIFPEVLKLILDLHWTEIYIILFCTTLG